MTDSSIQPAAVRRKRGISAIWLLPLIAVAVSGWLMFKNFVDHGLSITVSFDNGSGISVGKTPVIYQGINVGAVTALKLDEDLEGVTVTLELDRQVEPLIRKNAEFWLVKPRISLSGVSGLDTLVAGNYISFKPGDGEPAKHFDALLEPPPSAGNLPGLRLRLQTETLGSLTVGAPILYQQIAVGELEGYQLTGGGLELMVRIDPPYTHLVNSSSRFWQHSGLEVNAGLQGVNIKAGSIASILAGGIAFDTPDKKQPKIEDDTSFRLFESQRKAQGSQIITVRFPNPDGLDEGSRVRLRGMDVGRVDSWHFVDDQPDKGADIRLEIRAPYYRFLNENTQFWLVKPEVSVTGVKGFDALIGGPYVGMNILGEGGEVPARYTALGEAPQARIQAPGLRLKLRSQDSGSVGVGSKVYFRKIPVGQVESVDLDTRGVDIGVFIHERYARLVHRESVFWNASGVDISGNLGSFEFHAESLATIVAGGIAFRTPQVDKPQLAWEGLRYTLHPDYESTLTDESLEISLHFNSGTTINKGTEIKYQGIKVGEVLVAELDAGMDGVKVKARLVPSAKGLARRGSEFWLVRPQLGLGNTRNLETLVTGSFISVRPGQGALQKTFVALDKPPPLRKPETGLNLVLSAPQRGSVKQGVKVLYRDIPVGEVFDVELSPDARRTLIHINIEPRYAPLVRSGSKFWNSSGITINLGLFSGADIRSKSIESLLEGGIAFATPDAEGPTAPAYTVFDLHESAERSWLKWAPEIPLADL